MKDKLLRICRAFGLGGECTLCEEIPNGNVNITYKMNFTEEDGTCRSYILQSINTYAFREPVKLMENIGNVTEYINSRNIPNITLHFHRRPDMTNYYEDEDGTFWRVYDYVDSVTYNTTSNLKIVNNAGRAFGKFQVVLKDFDASVLHYTIADFHNTVKRYDTFEEHIRNDVCGRVIQVRDEIKWLMGMRSPACSLTNMLNRGELPLRVTHNDTKINNVLFDRNTGEAIVVIDLDTVMPGLVGHDFGDAIRFAANKCEEDCPDPSRAGIDMEVYRAFTEGFLSQLGTLLTDNEVETLALSAFVLACELAVRFLDDYICGDKYFRTDHPGHNLERARCQIALASDMLEHMDEMRSVVRESLMKLGKSRY